MAVSPWAKVREQLPDEEQPIAPAVMPNSEKNSPQVFAPVNDTPATVSKAMLPPDQEPKLDLHKNLAQIYAAPEPMPQLDPNPNHQITGHLQNQWQQEIAKDKPWNPDDHGVMGKIGHVMGKVGNIAGNIFAPGVMASIPGTQLNHQLREGQLAKQINEQQASEATNEHLDAQTAKAEQETERLKNPIPKEGVTPEEKAAHDLTTQINPDTGLKHTYYEAYQKVMQAKNDAKSEKPPVQPHITYDAGIPVSVTGPKGVWDVNDPKLPEELKPLVAAAVRAHGQHQAEGEAKDTRVASRAAETQARTFANQMKMFQLHQDTPTAATKTMAETAPKVIDLSNRAEQLIDQQVNTLGPASSRWAEFMAGKVGAPNPEFTKLRTNIGLLQTSLMRMHVGARGGEQIMEHFKNLIDASKQDPQNLKAALGEIRAYADEVGKSGKAQPSGGNTTPVSGGLQIQRDANGRIIGVK
jgi:hypothetical protein